MTLVVWKLAIIPVLALAACVACGGGSGVGAPNQGAAAAGEGAAAGAAVAAGAAAGSVAAGVAVTPTPQACPSALPAGAITLFQPASGSTVNASTNAVVFIETTASAPSDGWGSLTLNSTTEGALAPAAIPSPLPSGEAFLSAPITTPLMSGTTYQVAVTYTNGCGAPAAISLGAFTAQ